MFSSKIEGNSLDINSYFNQSQLSTKTKTKEVTEIQDLATAYQFCQSQKLNKNNFLKAHKLLSKSILDKINQGKYRTTPVGVFGVQGLIFMAIEPDNARSEIDKLFLEIKGIRIHELTASEAVFFAGLIHLKIAQIHPFVDGNGRMARLVEKRFLAQKFGLSIWSLQPEKFVWENRSEYYTKINLGQDYYNLNFDKAIDFCEFVTQGYLNNLY